MSELIELFMMIFRPRKLAMKRRGQFIDALRYGRR
jgi:hypothetical protein